MQVINRHHLKDAWPADHIYIGRGTALGNPFIIGPDGDRGKVIEKYSKWLTAKVDALVPTMNTAMRGLQPDATRLTIFLEGTPGTTPGTSAVELSCQT